MRRFGASGNHGPSSLTALQAAQGRVDPQDINIETALLEVEQDMFGVGNYRAGNFLALPSSGIATVASGPPSHNRQRQDDRRNIKYAVNDDVPGSSDGNSKDKIAKGIMQAANKQFGGLVSRFRCRMREFEKRVDFARDENDRWLVEKSALQEKIEDLKFEAQDLRDQMTSAMSISGPQRMFIAGRRPSAQQNIVRHGSDMSLDVDIDGMEQDTGIHKHVSMDGMWKRFKIRMRRLQHRWMPLQRDVKLISSRYGRACGGFFKFHRFLGCLSIAMSLSYLPLFIPHAISERSQMFKGPCGKLPISCDWFYGGFYKTDDSGNRDTWLAFRYLGVMMVSSLACLCLSISRWSTYDLIYQTEKVNENLQPRRWSKLVLMAWDFHLRSDEDRQNWQQSLTNQLRSMYDEEMEQVRAAQRTRLQWYLLYARRALGLFVNFLFICAAWAGIGWATVRRYDIEDAVSNILGGRAGSRIGAFAPNLIVAFVGMILPSVTKWITSHEAWGAVTMASHNMWRLYWGRIVNIFIFVAMCVELVANEPLFGQEKVLMQRDSEYACVEDQAGVRLLSLVVSEFALSLALKPLLKLLSDFLYARVTGYPFQMSPFEIADYAVDIIYFQCLLWVTAIFMPTVVLFAPLLLFGHFKWLKFTLLFFTSRPFVAECTTLCVSQLKIHCVSCVIFITAVGALATRALPHAAGCGPFDSQVAPGTMLHALHFHGKSFVYSFGNWCLQNPQIGFGILSLFLLFSLFSRNRGQALEAALKQLQRASQRHVEALEGELWRMERQNELLNRRVQWQGA